MTQADNKNIDKDKMIDLIMKDAIIIEHKLLFPTRLGRQAIVSFMVDGKEKQICTYSFAHAPPYKKEKTKKTHLNLLRGYLEKFTTDKETLSRHPYYLSLNHEKTK